MNPKSPSPMQALLAAVMNAAAAKLMPRAANPMQALPSFAGQRTNPQRNEERLILRSMGKRQYKKMQRRDARS